MNKGWLGKAFRQGKLESGVVINLGNYSLKGLILKEGKAVDYFIEPNRDLGSTLSKIWADKKITAANVNLSLKHPSCLVRYFSFPKTERKQLQQALFYEMNKFIPFAPEDVYFDFAVLKETSPSQIFILLAVAKKDFIDGVLDVFSSANINVSTLTLDSLCLSNLFLSDPSPAAAANPCILDIGYKYSTMTIFSQGVPFLTRDVKVNASEIFQIVSRIKNINLEEMHNWVLGLSDTGEFLSLAHDTIANLCKEMKNSFDYFEVNSGEHISKLYITGGIAAVKGISQIFRDILDIEADILPVLSDNRLADSFPANDQKFMALANAFSVCFGLAL